MILCKFSTAGPVLFQKRTVRYKFFLLIPSYNNCIAPTCQAGFVTHSKTEGLPYTPVIPDPAFFSYILESDFFKHMLAPGVFCNRIRVYRGHPQNIESVLQGQLLRAGSIPTSFYKIILHMDA